MTEKKPAASVDKFYLRPIIRRLLRVANGQPEKQQHETLQTVLVLSRKLRRYEGAGLWWPIAFAALVFVLLLYVGKRESARDYTYSAPADVHQVLVRHGAYHYQLNHIHNGSAHTEEAVFCPNYEPQLSAGQTLTWLHYMDLGKCWNIQPEGYGYRLQRDSAGRPTLAPNCHAGPEVVACEPNFKEARF